MLLVDKILNHGNKMKNYRIEKGIPIHSGNIYWNSLIAKMEVGDSILFSTRGAARGAIEAIKSQGFKYTGRTVPDGYRVWRKEDDKENI